MDGTIDWEQRYQADGAIWGDGPSPLGRFVTAWLAVRRRVGPETRVLDVGCGYGRDSAYMAAILGASVLGIDLSSEAIDRAIASVNPQLPTLFRCCAFADLEPEPFDVILAANLYHCLTPGERSWFQADVMAHLAPGGVLALNALAVGDPQHYGKGEPVRDEIDSFIDAGYLHFFSRDELVDDFEGLRPLELFEHSYDEPRSDGTVHHHRSWMMLSQR